MNSFKLQRPRYQQQFGDISNPFATVSGRDPRRSRAIISTEFDIEINPF